jgi:hypothetical protein
MTPRLFALGMGRPGSIHASLAPVIPKPSLDVQNPDQDVDLISLNAWYTSKLLEISSNALDRM